MIHSDLVGSSKAIKKMIIFVFGLRKARWLSSKAVPTVFLWSSYSGGVG